MLYSDNLKNAIFTGYRSPQVEIWVEFRHVTDSIRQKLVQFTSRNHENTGGQTAFEQPESHLVQSAVTG